MKDNLLAAGYAVIVVAAVIKGRCSAPVARLFDTGIFLLSLVLLVFVCAK